MTIRPPVPPVGANHTEWYAARDAELRSDERKHVLDEVRHFDVFVAAEVGDALAGGDPWTGKVTMLYLDGSATSYRCDECGANCFTAHVANPRRYRCNGCSATYTAESAVTKESP
jgi:DNA-directed RNA polymerase subunit RPC12/RpoP